MSHIRPNSNSRPVLAFVSMAYNAAFMMVASTPIVDGGLGLDVSVSGPQSLSVANDGTAVAAGHYVSSIIGPRHHHRGDSLPLSRSKVRLVWRITHHSVLPCDPLPAHRHGRLCCSLGRTRRTGDVGTDTSGIAFL